MLASRFIGNVDATGRRTLLVVTVLAVFLALPRAAEGRGRLSERRICSSYRCRTLAASAKIRVFKTAERYPAQEGAYKVFAEWLETGRLTILTGGQIEERVLGRFTIAGQFVAYSSGAGMSDEFGETAVLLNAKTGRERKMPGTDFQEPSPGVVQVVATRAGSLAWMIEGYFANPTGGPEPGLVSERAIYALRAGAREPVLLAYSENIVSMSLAATSGHIYWLEASGPRTLAAA